MFASFWARSASCSRSVIAHGQHQPLGKFAGRPTARCDDVLAPWALSTARLDCVVHHLGLDPRQRGSMPVVFG
jgi:hypothetical protein